MEDVKDFMNRTEKIEEENTKIPRKLIYGGIIVIILLFLLVGGYFISEKYFANEPASTQKDLGDQVIITLPNGKKVYTYENLVVEEDGKLLYRGERNTIDLTGGVVVYEKWENQ